MPVITNVSPYGDLDVPLLRQVVEAGASVDVSDDQAHRLLPQGENWAPADDAAQVIADTLTAELEALNDADDGPPAKSAPKAAWIGYAQAQGDADAESKTKEQLIEQYGETS